MARKVIIPAGVAPSPNPLSAAIASGHLVFVSGQIGAGAQGIEAQTRSALERMAAVLKAAGTDLGHVLRCTIYITDRSNFATMNRVYKEFFPSDPPARSTIVTGLVSVDYLVEIECIAEVP